MTAAALDRIGQHGNTVARGPDRIGQATAVEQARAVAEVAAAVQVAQMNPRDMNRALADMRRTCSSPALARKAFYAVPNRGEGETVHLARALARIWGNIDYGVRELRRDDGARESEVQAFAWDQQTNSRSTRSFINPHAKMAGGKRKDIDDLDDIYRSNQNVGAKAVRECIFAVLPEEFIEEAARLCRETLAREHEQSGQSNDEAFREAAGHWSRQGVSERQLLDRIGKPVDQWTPQDFASLVVLWESIRRGETTVEEQFPQPRVTAAEIQAPREQAAPPAPLPTQRDAASRAQVGKIQALFAAAGITERDARLRYCEDVVGHPVETTNELSKAEASDVIEALERDAS
jgi:hypothetical protein